MFARLFGWLLRPVIEAEIKRLIQVNKPLIKALKTSEIQNSKATVWDVLANGDAKEISLCIRWIDKYDLEDFKVYSAQDMADLKFMMKNIEPTHDRFESVSLHVKPIGSNSSFVEQLSKNGSWNKHYYDFDQLEVAFQPVIEWINGHPEHLI